MPTLTHQVIAEREVANMQSDSPDSAARHMALGTVLLEQVSLPLPRMAQQEASARRLELGR
jgi:hypothetical protein